MMAFFSATGDLGGVSLDTMGEGGAAKTNKLNIILSAYI